MQRRLEVLEDEAAKMNEFSLMIYDINKEKQKEILRSINQLTEP